MARADRDAARRNWLMALAALGLMAAFPLGWELGPWVILGNLPFGAELSRHWRMIPSALALGVILTVMARRASRPALLALTLAVLVVCGLGAWRGVAARVEAYREGPLNAAL